MATMDLASSGVPVKVSVQITTYNHEKFIGQAIESALKQVVNFSYEILISEDCSTDRTREIILRYHEAYPDKIRLLLREKNLGPNHNMAQTLSACRGQYIALLEGDDYWISAHKLQKQVDFLDSNADCAICCHNALIVYENGSEMSYPFYSEQQDRPFTRKKPKPFSTIADLVRGNFLQAASVMFRAGLFPGFPDWYYQLSCGDWLLYILNTEHGNIGYIDEIMAAYRMHPKGLFSARPAVEKLKGAVDAAWLIDKYLDHRYHSVIARANVNRIVRMISLLQDAGNYRQAFAYIWHFIVHYGLTHQQTRKILKQFFHSYLKRLSLLWGLGQSPHQAQTDD